MPRCSCASACACLIAAGPGVTVNGSGSAASPYIISARRSTDADNCLTFGTDNGLYVSCSGRGGDGGGATVDGLPPTGVIAGHRGAMALAPENTLLSYRLARSLGCHIVEFDVRSASDGTLVCIHDATLERTTTHTGPVADLDGPGAANAVIVDGAATRWYGIGLNGTTLDGGINRIDQLNQPLPLLDDVLAEVGGSVVLSPEIKTPDVGPLLLTAIQRHRLAQSVIVQSTNRDDLPPFVEAGIAAAMVIGDEAAATANPASELMAAGITWVYCARTLSEATISGYVAAGLSVLVWVVNRHVHRRAMELIGVRGVISDNPVYVAEGALRPYRRTTDPWNTYAAAHGQMGVRSDAGDYAADTSGGRPSWNRPGPNPPAEPLDYWLVSQATGEVGATADAYTVLAGWACPLDEATAAGTYAIDLWIGWQFLPADTSRWIGFVLATPDDHAFVDGDASTPADIGYIVAFRANGLLDIYRRDGTTILQLSDTGSRWLPGAAQPWETGDPAVHYSYHVRMQVTPTQIAATGVDTGSPQVVAADTTYRGRYLHLAKHNGTTPFTAIFGGMTITAGGGLTDPGGEPPAQTTTSP